MPILRRSAFDQSAKDVGRVVGVFTRRENRIKDVIGAERHGFLCVYSILMSTGTEGVLLY
jgi:hypothetical protein